MLLIDDSTKPEVNYISEILAYIFATAFVFLVLIIPGILFHFALGSPNKKYKPLKISRKLAIIMSGIWLSFFICFCFHIGYNTTSEQTKFRVIDNKYAIVYENDEYYYLAKYDVMKNKIDKNIQKAVSKDGIEYIWKE